MLLDEKRNFKLAVVDDQPGSVAEHIKEIARLIKEKYGRSLEQVTISEQFETLDKIDHTVDAVIVDKGLGDIDGIEVVKAIKEKRTLLDILVYTGGNMDDQYIANLSDYSMVEVVRDRDFVDRLMEIIERSLSLWDNVSYLRGITISRIIELETEINEVVMKAFQPLDENQQKQFRNSILENIDIPLQAKKHMLSVIQKSAGEDLFDLGVLNTLQEQRNRLAHAKKNDKRTDVLIVGKRGTEPITKKKIIELFDQASSFSECLKAFKPNHN